MRKTLVTGAVLSIALTGASVFATDTQPISANGHVENFSTVKYNDFKAGEYWSEDMLWAIDNKLIKGYVNAAHPATKKAGNWLNPFGHLTEGQMTTILMRYAKPDELARAQNTVKSSWWAAPDYSVALKYQLPLKASAVNSHFSNQKTTRGIMAQSMATLYYGEPMSLEASIDFMYRSEISTGYPDENGKPILSQASFGANDPLTRSHIVTFVKRFDDYVKANPGVPVTPPVIAPPNGQVVGEIKVDYGRHTYGSKNQAEYDFVMKKVKEAIATPKHSWDWTGRGTPYYEEYLNGARAIGFDRTDRNTRTERNTYLTSAHIALSELVAAGLSNDAIRDIGANNATAHLLLSSAYDPGNGAPRSAYDALGNGVKDCDPIAHVYAAVYDAKGYNTVVLTRPGHAFTLAEIEGKWIEVTVGKNEIVNIQEMLNSGLKVHVQPTNGKILE